MTVPVAMVDEKNFEEDLADLRVRVRTASRSGNALSVPGGCALPRCAESVARSCARSAQTRGPMRTPLTDRDAAVERRRTVWKLTRMY